MFVFKAAVVGAGALGVEIAEAIAAAGIEVLLKGDAAPASELITPTTSFDGFGDVDLVIEAGPEDLELKHEVFADLDACTPGHAILASATSALSITEIGEITLRPDKVVGLPFIAGTRVVEVVEGGDTSAETVQAAANFALALRRTPVR